MSNINILIVEDELIIAENLAMKLEQLKYNVSGIVSTGKAALEKVELHDLDLILMDIAIKGDLDGIQTANKIKELHDVAVIFLTAYADEKTLERAASTGCYGYLLKPFKDRELHATIKMAIKKYDEQKVAAQSLVEMNKLLGEYSSEKNIIYEDSLTKLPNRLMLRELFSYLSSGLETSSNLERASEQLNVNKKLLAVVYLKLDRFERILAYLGDVKSDLLIEAVVNRLREVTNNCDREAIPLKIEYSEFCILLSGLDKRQPASDFTQLILEQLRQPFVISDDQIFLTASVGISFYPFDNLEIERLLEQAKQAMVYAQEQGGNKYKLYTSAFRIMTSNNSSDLALEADLHQAVETNELELYYQPKVHLKTGKVLSAEALIRWNHPKLGLILPARILPLAEVSGLMDKISVWVLTEACNQAKTWHQAGFDFLRIAINVSGHQFKQSNLFYQLTNILSETKLDTQFLELELTEQILVENIQSNIQKLNLIKNLGVQISLDDFGTGYSSLGYLHQFPFDVLKIDRSFVSNVDQNSKNAVIIKSIINMAHELGLKVVAEGVETKSELAFISDCQCDEVQGYLFSRPLPVREFGKFLAKNKRFDLTTFKRLTADL